jgi:tetratricopeptide (TPR) repeat protein
MTTTFEELNRCLKQAEKWTPRLRTAGAEQVIEVITALDCAQALVDALVEGGARQPAEEMQRIEVIETALRKHIGRAVRALEAGGVSLETVAAAQARLPEAWWWHLAELVRERRRRLLRAWLTRAGIALAVVAVAFVLSRTLLAPDPLVVARVEAIQQAQEAVLEDGDFQAALDALEAGLATVRVLQEERDEPANTADLMTWRGVVLEALDRQDEAAADFAAAEEQDRWEMLIQRVQLYLYLVPKPEAALTDAQELTTLDPDHPSGFMLLGDAYQAVGDRMSADEAYQRAEELSFAREEHASIYVLVRQRRQALWQQQVLPEP